MSQQSSSANHIQTLDVLRGLAASLVVLDHVLLTISGFDAEKETALTTEWWGRNIFLGAFAVTLFFVVSGTSLSLSAFSKSGGFNARSFFIRRFFRLYPLYVLVILIGFCLRPLYTTYVGWGIASFQTWLGFEQFGRPATATVWLTHLTLTFNLFQVPANFDSAIWTLPVEVQFYLLFPIMLFLLQLGRRRGLLLFALFLGVIHVLSFVDSPSFMALLRAWEFGGGVLIGMYWRQIAALMRRPRVRLLAIVAALILFEVSRVPMTLPLIPDNLLEVFFCFLVVALALSFANWQPQGRPGQLLVNIGNWSYSLYLIHALVIAALTPLLHALNLSPFFYFIVAFPSVYVLSLFISRFLYNRFERPFIRLGARYARPRPLQAIPAVPNLP